MNAVLWFFLSVDELLYHRHSRSFGGLEDLRLRASLGNGLLDLLEEAFHVDLGPALGALRTTPLVSLMLLVLKHMRYEVPFLLDKWDAALRIDFSLLLQEVIGIPEEDVHALCCNHKDVSKVLISGLLVSQEIFWDFFSSSLLCEGFDGSLKGLPGSHALFLLEVVHEEEWPQRVKVLKFQTMIQVREFLIGDMWRPRFPQLKAGDPDVRLVEDVESQLLGGIEKSHQFGGFPGQMPVIDATHSLVAIS